MPLDLWESFERKHSYQIQKNGNDNVKQFTPHLHLQ